MRISDWSSDVCSSDLLTSSATGSHGQLQLNANGSYTYTLTSPVDGPTANDGPLTLAGAEVFTYQAVDGSGNIANGTITIDVVDDVTTAADDEIGRATCRERVCQYVEISVVAVSCKKTENMLAEDSR